MANVELLGNILKLLCYLGDLSRPWCVPPWTHVPFKDTQAFLHTHPLPKFLGKKHPEIGVSPRSNPVVGRSNDLCWECAWKIFVENKSCFSYSSVPKPLEDLAASASCSCWSSLVSSAQNHCLLFPTEPGFICGCTGMHYASVNI